MRQGLNKSGLDTYTMDMILLGDKTSSTSRYLGVWEKFLLFLSWRRISISDMSVGVVCNFLHYQASVMSRKYRTFPNYCIALICLQNLRLISDLFLRITYSTHHTGHWTWIFGSFRINQTTLFLLLLAFRRRISKITRAVPKAWSRGG